MKILAKQNVLVNGMWLEKGKTSEVEEPMGRMIIDMGWGEEAAAPAEEPKKKAAKKKKTAK